MKTGKGYLLQRPKISRRRRRLLFFTGAVLLLVLVLAFSAYIMNAFSSFQNKEEWARELSLSGSGDEVCYLLYGVDYWGANPYVERLVLVHQDTVTGTVHMLYIPGNTMLAGDTRPGEPLGQIYRHLSREDFICRVEEVAGLPVHHYLELHYEGLVVLNDFLGGVPSASLPEGPDEELLPDNKDYLKGFEIYSYFTTAEYGESPEAHLDRQRSALLQLWNMLQKVKFWQWPGLLNKTAPYFETDLSWRELKEKAEEFSDYDYEEVNKLVLPGSEEVINGGLLWVIDADKAEQVIAMVNEGYLVNPGDVTIEVLNGSGVQGLASKAASDLESLGFVVERVGNADHFDYEETLVIALEDKVDKARAVALQIPGSSMLHEKDPGAGTAVRVILGKNYIENE